MIRISTNHRMVSLTLIRSLDTLHTINILICASCVVLWPCSLDCTLH